MEKGWNIPESNGGLNLMERINNCCRGLARWKRSLKMNSRSNIERLSKRLEEEMAKLHPNFRTMSRLKSELAEAHRQEELFWRQKCRELWLKEGDKNTTFFHNSAKRQKIKNIVLLLKDELGTEFFSEGAKENLAVEYFREL